MIIATMFYVICIFALTLYYQRKIKKLNKEIRYLSDVRKLISHEQEKTKYSFEKGRKKERYEKWIDKFVDLYRQAKNEFLNYKWGENEPQN